MVITQIPMPRAHEPRHQDDATLVLARWIDQHQPGAWRYLRFLGCPQDRLDDILQDAFIAAIEQELPSRPAPVAAAWLRTTVRNLYLMGLRAAHNRPAVAELSDQAAIDAAWQRFVGGESQGDQALEFLSLCLEHIAPRTRRCLDRFYGEGIRREAIASELGIAVEGVKTMLRRAKDELRTCIENKRRTAR